MTLSLVRPGPATILLVATWGKLFTHIASSVFSAPKKTDGTKGSIIHVTYSDYDTPYDRREFNVDSNFKS